MSLKGMGQGSAFQTGAHREQLYSDNQDENLATIRMRESPPLALGGRA